MIVIIFNEKELLILSSKKPMNKKEVFSYLSCLCLFFAAAPAFAQSEAGIKEIVTQPEVEKHIRFLASDELQGRDTGSPELDIAARYIAESFRANGVKPADSTYFQEVRLRQSSAPEEGKLQIGKEVYNMPDDLLLLAGENVELNAPLLYLNHGTEEDLAKADVKGKIAIVKAGLPGETSPQAWFYSSGEKRRRLAEKGAKAVIELYNNPQLPWKVLVNYLNNDQLQLDTQQEGEEAAIPLFWLQDSKNTILKKVAESKKAEAKLVVKGKLNQPVKSKNVIGIIEGTDPELKDEYVMLSAHYDHVGVKRGTNDADTIFNGARDNAIGTSAIMMAAKYFAEHPPKRSILLAAWTAEEKGLLGSAWYAENPVIPVEKIVYNLNIDGAGYNDTTKITVIGLERTEAEQDFINAARAFGLEAIQDPVPEQNLFDRSDNVNFAKKGVPAPTFSPGVTAFDEELMKYYHQVTDNPETLNFPYVTSYTRAFTLAAEKIANASKAPFWKKGDKYEAAGVELYGR